MGSKKREMKKDISDTYEQKRLYRDKPTTQTKQEREQVTNINNTKQASLSGKEKFHCTQVPSG